MAGRGVFFALTHQEIQSMMTESADDVVAQLEDVEEQWDEEWLVECDKAWDAMHRCLGDGTLGTSTGPLAKAVLGGQLVQNEDGYLASLLRPTEVVETARAMQMIDRAWLAGRYETLKDTDYDGPHGAEDLEYTWENFVEVRALFLKAASEGRGMAFTVSM